MFTPHQHLLPDQRGHAGIDREFHQPFLVGFVAGVILVIAFLLLTTS
jgi:hypothetical protein